MSLIPRAQLYFELGANVLLIGKHGVGKSQLVMELAEENQIKMKYYSCATLDAYTDLVGIPKEKPYLDDYGVQLNGEDGLPLTTIKMVRPREVDEAQLIFFDELNRADDKTLNTVLEIIQFHSINGEKLPNLRACWGGINPPEGEYHVSELDPALVDRFQFYEQIEARPTIRYYQDYFTGKFEDKYSSKVYKAVAQALVNWWADHDVAIKDDQEKAKTCYVSPRRLEYIGWATLSLGSSQDIKKLLPPGGEYDHAKLGEMLTYALNADKVQAGKTGLSDAEKAGLGPNASLTYTSDWIYKHLDFTVEQLKNEDCTDETKQRAVDAVSERCGADRWIEIMERFVSESAVQGALIETAFQSLDETKQEEINGKVEANTLLDKYMWNYE